MRLLGGGHSHALWANMTGPTCALALEGFHLRQGRDATAMAEYVLYIQLP